MEELDKIVNEFFKKADEFIERQKEYEKRKTEKRINLMEEDIKNLEKYIQKILNFFDEDELEDTDGFHISYKEIKQIKNLIARYKETKQELESVKEIYYTQKEIETNYIPKSKVQEKIEDLEKRGYFEEANAMKELLKD